jgi:hypothetical protein
MSTYQLMKALLIAAGELISTEAFVGMAVTRYASLCKFLARTRPA